ncbi:MAG: hypothetical protein ACR2O7_03090 [Parasphingorhabdus sp.]
MNEKPTITQADRESAADFTQEAAQCDAGRGFLVALRKGELDHTPVVQAFAAHREGAVAELQAENERLREALTEISDTFQKYARHPQYCKSNAPHLKPEYGVDHCDCGLTESLREVAALAQKEPVE